MVERGVEGCQLPLRLGNYEASKISENKNRGSTDIQGTPKVGSYVLCRLFLASAPAALSLRLSVALVASCSASAPTLRIDARLPVFRNLTDFISFKKAAILSPPKFTVGCPVRLVVDGAYAELIGASTGRMVCFKAALAEERNSSVVLELDTGNRTGGAESNAGGGGGGGGGIIVDLDCGLSRGLGSDTLRRSS